MINNIKSKFKMAFCNLPFKLSLLILSILSLRSISVIGDSLHSTADPKLSCKDALAPGGVYSKDINGTVTESVASESASESSAASSKESTKYVCRDSHYLTVYDLDLKLPLYSAYHITSQEAQHELGGRHSFRQDPQIPLDHQPPIHSKCWSQKWNRGHLCPSRIMSYDKGNHDSNGNDEPTDQSSWADTYYITNTAMQWGHFNQRTWEHLESHVWEWIKNGGYGKSEGDGDLYIVTGTAVRGMVKKSESSNTESKSSDLKMTTCDIDTGKINFVDYRSSRKNNLNRIVNSTKFMSLSPSSDTNNWMAVPDYYYKALCDYSTGKSIAYIGHNRDQDDAVHELSVDDLVHLYTGLEIFPKDKCNTGIKESEYFWKEDLNSMISKKSLSHLDENVRRYYSGVVTALPEVKSLSEDEQQIIHI